MLVGLGNGYYPVKQVRALVEEELGKKIDCFTIETTSVTDCKIITMGGLAEIDGESIPFLVELPSTVPEKRMMDEQAAKTQLTEALRVAEQGIRQWLRERLLDEAWPLKDIIAAMIRDYAWLYGTGSDEPRGFLDHDALVKLKE